MSCPVHKLYTSMLAYVVDLSALPAIAVVIADEDAFPVNICIYRLWYMLLIYQFSLLLLMLYQTKTPFQIISYLHRFWCILLIYQLSLLLLLLFQMKTFVMTITD